MARGTRTPKWAGKNAKWLFSLDDQQTAIDVVSFKVTEVADVVEDDFCGEDRTDSQKLTKYYDVELQCKQTKFEILERMLVDTENTDSNTEPLEGWVAVKVTFNDETQKALSMAGFTILPWELNVGGQRQRNEMPLKVRVKWIRGLAL
jgi:hypothetical protein